VKQYGKFIATVFFAAVTAIVAALVDDRVDAGEWINVALAAGTTISVLGAGELPAGIWKHTKTIVTGAMAGLTLLVSFVSDGGYITTTEWLQVGLAVAATFGVAFTPGPKVEPVNYGEHAAP
jgi:hypothetical protein